MKVSEQKNLEIKQMDQVLKRLQKNKQRQIQGEANQIENLKKFYKSQKEEVRFKGEEEVLNQRIAADTTLMKSVDEQQEKLNTYLGRLKVEEQKLDEQKRLLDKEKSESLAAAERTLQAQIKEKMTAQKDLQVELGEKGQEAMAQIRQEQQNEATVLRAQSIENQNNLQTTADLKLKRDAASLEEQRTIKKNTHLRDMALEQRAHQDKLRVLNRQTDHEMRDKQLLHQKQLAQEDANFTATLTGQRQAFEQKYQSMMENHQKVLNRLQSQMDIELKTLSKENSSLKSDYQSKVNDPFYRQDTLSPTLLDQKDHYLVSLKIPEYESDDVHVNANKRTIEINLVRSYKGNHHDPESGSTNRTSRSESFSKSLKVADILDGRGITQSYHDGMLHFKIPKA